MTNFWLFALLVFSACAKANFKNSPATQTPLSEGGEEDGIAPSAGGDQDGIGNGGTTPGDIPPGGSYPPGSKEPPIATTPPEEDTPDVITNPPPVPPKTPGEIFVRCADGSDQVTYPIFAKAYEFGLQDIFPAEKTSTWALASLYFGFNPELEKPPGEGVDYGSLPQSIASYELVKSAMVGLKEFKRDNKTMDFLFKNFLEAKIDENVGGNTPTKFNYRTEFCMQNFDVSQRRWAGGFPDTNAHNASQLKEWFTIRAAAGFEVPADGEYKFLLASDDGSLFQLVEQNGDKYGEIMALSNDGVHSVGEAKQLSVNLMASKKFKGSTQRYIMHMRYFQGPRDYVALQLFWKKPGDAEWSIVPASAFVYDKTLLDKNGHRPY
jgi:hypothetical protein